jgi:hypothetical protein
MKLFDYIKVLFSTEEKWNKLKPYDKIKNNFMVNRFMSIKFPIQANLFNLLKTDPVGTAESWKMVASKFNRVPGWIYTRVRKTKKEKKWEPKPEAIEFYMKVNEIGKREFEEAVKFHPTQMKVIIGKLEKQISGNVH